MIFGNKQCEDNHVVSINGMNIKRVYVTNFLGVHIDSHLNWGEHINHIKSKISKNVSILRRVKHLLINSALYSLYSTAVMPYLNYCCEIWGNTYKSRIQPQHIIKKHAIRICQKADYRSHSRPLFYQLKTLNHKVRMQTCNFKIKFSRTTKNLNVLVYRGQRCGMTCLLILKCVSRCLHLKKITKLYFCNLINLGNGFVFY